MVHTRGQMLIDDVAQDATSQAAPLKIQPKWRSRCSRKCLFHFRPSETYRLIVNEPWKSCYARTRSCTRVASSPAPITTTQVRTLLFSLEPEADKPDVGEQKAAFSAGSGESRVFTGVPWRADAWKSFSAQVKTNLKPALKTADSGISPTAITLTSTVCSLCPGI